MKSKRMQESTAIQYAEIHEYITNSENVFHQMIDDWGTNKPEWNILHTDLFKNSMKHIVSKSPEGAKPHLRF